MSFPAASSNGLMWRQRLAKAYQKIALTSGFPGLIAALWGTRVGRKIGIASCLR